MEITNLTKATARQEFLQAYLPSSIVKQLNLEPGDELIWSIEKRNGGIVLLAVPVQKTDPS